MIHRLGLGHSSTSVGSGTVVAMTASRSPSPPPDRATTLSVRTPEDLLATVPLVLGFPPTESVVMMTFAGRRQPSARVGLPDDPGDVPEVVATLVGAMVRNDVRLVAVLVYDGDERLVTTLAAALVDGCIQAGIEVVECLAVADGRYRSLLPGRLGPAEGTPFDISNHPFVAESVLAGRVRHPSREALAATLDRDEDAAARVDALVGRAGQGSAPPGRDRVASALWATTRVRRWTGERTLPSDEEVARLLVDLLDVDVRDEVWRLLTRETSLAWVDLWSDVTRRAPAPLGAAPATLAGFGAWVSGDGALAWCAVDRAHAERPDYSCASLLGELLDAAAPPDLWEVVRGSWDPSHNPA